MKITHVFNYAEAVAHDSQFNCYSLFVSFANVKAEVVASFYDNDSTSILLTPLSLDRTLSNALEDQLEEYVREKILDRK